MFDFKGGIEFNSTYETFGKVITDRQKAIEILDRLKLENDLRMEELKKYNAKNITMLYPITEQISQKIEHEKEIQFTSDDDVIVRVRFVDLFDIKKSLLGLIDL